MSAAKNYPQLGEDEFQEWLGSLGLVSPGGEDRPFREQIRDGVLLCQLVNKIRPGSVDIVSRVAYTLINKSLQYGSRVTGRVR